MRIMVPSEKWEQLEKAVKKYEATNIENLSDDVLNALKVGDLVIKKTGNQGHQYRVSYKEENHGICLSYYDAGCLETVSYDYTEGHWVFNSKDVSIIPQNVPGVFYQSVTIESTDWDNDEVELENSLFTANNVIVIREDASEGRENYEAVRDAELIGTASNGTLTISASTAPAGDIVLLITVITNAQEME